eukprot:1136136-Pelagomonas_calceolata.AAC.4
MARLTQQYHVQKKEYLGMMFDKIPISTMPPRRPSSLVWQAWLVFVLLYINTRSLTATHTPPPRCMLPHACAP